MEVTNENRFSFDEAILGLYIELAAFCDLLAFSLLLAVGLTVLLYQISDIFDSFLCILKGLIETGILGLDIDDYFEVILLFVDLVLHEEGDLGA